MDWNPWNKPENKPTPSGEVGGDQKPPEKTPAELIAESVASAIAPLAAAIAAQEGRFTTLEAQTKPAPPKPQEVGEIMSVLDNEDVAFAQRLTPLMARQLELEARIVKSDIKTEYVAAGFGDLLKKFEGEINTTIDGSGLVTTEGKPLRGDPQYVRNVIDMILGRAARAAGMKFDSKDRGFFLETGGSGNDSPTSGGVPDGMTDAQRRVTTRMGIPLDKAKEVIKKLQFVS